MQAASHKPRVIVICGPTGVGKTAAAVALAEAIGAQIISADSMQVYRYMDIGTAKPTAAEQVRVTHYMIDVVDPDEHFDAVRYAQMARAAVLNLCRKGIVPLVVGGTGLYIKSLLLGIFSAPPINADIRERLRREAARYGSRVLYQRLKERDPHTAGRLHPNDTYRVIRALETLEATGKSITRWQQEHAFAEESFRVLKIGLHMERPELYERIDRRVEGMMAAGLVEEVEGLLARGYAPGLKSMQAIGYRHAVDYLQGRLSREECVRTLKRDHRRYAKRQLTWFRADPQITWEAPDESEKIRNRIEFFLGSR